MNSNATDSKLPRMATNPFSKKAGAEPEVLKIPDEVLPGGNYCPLLTSTELGFIPVGGPSAQELLANPNAAMQQQAQPVLGPKFLKCIGDKCSFWRRDRCVLVGGLEALTFGAEK